MQFDFSLFILDVGWLKLLTMHKGSDVFRLLKYPVYTNLILVSLEQYLILGWQGKLVYC